MRRRALGERLVFLVGCAGSAEPERFAEKSADLSVSIVPTDIETAGRLGQGIDLLTEEFRGDCVRSATSVQIPLQEASLRFDSSMSKEEASEKLGFSSKAKARYKMVSGSARARFSRSLAQSSLSMGMFYVADYSLGVERLDQATLSWLVEPGDPDWIRRCGDQVLQQREVGGQLYLLYRIDFASSDAKQEFEGSVGVSFPAGEVNAAVSRAASRFSSRATVHVEALQIGGDVTRLSSILGADVSAPNAGRVIIDCSLTNLAPCGQFMQNAISYASAQTPGSFSATLRQSPADRTYLFKDWDVLGVALPRRRVPDAVEASRELLRQLFDGQVELADRVALLRGGSLFVHPELRAQLDGYARTLQNNLDLISDAVHECYDEQTDPADDAQVARCTRSVDGLDDQGFDRSLTSSALVVPPPSLGAKVVERTDPTGMLTVAIFERQADVAAQHVNDFAVSVSPDFVVIGGGAEAAALPAGNLLTASYPSADGWTWLTSSKDHFVAHAVRMRAYAIGLKVAGLSRDELRGALWVGSQRSAHSVAPEATVTLPSEYALLGGGFAVDYGSVGNLAVKSFPEDAQTWRAKSSSLGIEDASTLEVYAIGLLRSLPGIGNITTSFQSVVSSAQAHPSAFVQPPAGTLLVGCGASAAVTSPCRSRFCTPFTQGQLLWKIAPDPSLSGCNVGSKDHQFSSPGTITAYALGIAAN